MFFAPPDDVFPPELKVAILTRKPSLNTRIAAGFLERHQYSITSVSQEEDASVGCVDLN
jgi:hypothetical protein